MPTPNGGDGNRLTSANDRGVLPATLVPPASFATTKEDTDDRDAETIVLPRCFRAAAREVARDVPDLPTFEASGIEAGAEFDIEDAFRRALSGLRYLPRRDRPHALRRAREERAARLRALRERRAVERHARWLLRKLLSREPQ
ncbi:MAG: hypothetical protein ABSC25_23100 [Roseiarcus sp.]|jgi:hypothetical protein